MNDQEQNLQPALAGLGELDDNALLFSREQLLETKRYTAEQVKGLEWKRNAVVLLLASDWPVETIASQLGVNTRTVRAIAARSAQEVAHSSKMFARICQGLGARWLGLAKTKENEASFLQLATAGAIAVDKAVLLESMGQFSDVAETKGGEDKAQAMAAIRALMAKQAPADDSASDAKSLIPGQSDDLTVDDAPGVAPGQAQDPALAGLDAAAQAAPRGAGGGAAPGAPSAGPMDCPNQELQQRGPVQEGTPPSDPRKTPEKPPKNPPQTP